MSISYGTSGGNEYWDIRGNSSDEKPTDKKIPDGSTFYEKDTQKVFMFDAGTKTWIEQ